MSTALEELLKEGAHIDYGVPFEEATYFVFRRLDENGDELFQWENGNPVVEQGLIKSIMEVIQEKPEGKVYHYSGSNYFYSGIVNQAAYRFEIIPEAKFFIIKIFLELSPAWKNLTDNQKQLLINIFSYALMDSRKDILTYKCIERYPELLDQRLKGEGHTPLMFAIRHSIPRTCLERIRLVQTMLSISKKTIDVQNDNGDTALMMAPMDCSAISHMLLDAGADPRIQNYYGETFITQAYSSCLHSYRGWIHDTELIQRLPLPDINNPEQRKILLFNLQRAIKNADITVVKEILSLGISPDEKSIDGDVHGDRRGDRAGITALQCLNDADTEYATRNKREELVRFLLAEYPNLNLTSALHPENTYYDQARPYQPQLEEHEMQTPEWQTYEVKLYDAISDEDYMRELEDLTRLQEESMYQRFKNWFFE